MQVAQAVKGYALIVGFCSVTLVAGEVIAGELFMVFLHHPVPGHFGQNGGRRNGRAQAVSLYNARLGQFQTI